MLAELNLLEKARPDYSSDLMTCACLVCQGKGAFSRDKNKLADISMTDDARIPSTIVTVPNSDSRITGTLTAATPRDIYSMTLEAGQTYSFALRSAGPGGIQDPLLGIRDSAGTVLQIDDDGGLGNSSLLTYTATTTGTYQIVARSTNPADIGGYTLDMWKAPATDQVPGTIEGALRITPGTYYGNFEKPAPGDEYDQDAYSIYLTAGLLYQFQVAGGTDYSLFSTGFLPGESDPVIGLFDSTGKLLEFSDDVRFPEVLDGKIIYVPTESGVYYVATASRWSFTGGYTLDVTETDLAKVDPLDSINWFTSSTIPTTVVNGVETAYVYFGDSDENFGQTNDSGTGPMKTIDWNAFEKQQVMVALEEYTRILGINYVVTDDSSVATFRLLKTESGQYGAYFFPQDEQFGDNQGVGVFNVLSGGWNAPGQASLEKGGYAFMTMLHEFGHAHGLAHPHDNGGDSEIMLGVEGAQGPDSYGLYNLNQGVYTVMSYNSSWMFHPDGETPLNREHADSGWPGTLSAFDIAVLQQKYGAVERNTGDNVYQLRDIDDLGTYYQTIWDSAGTDEIRYDGARASQIDLLAATLDYSPTGGGVISFVDDIKGGYTIANGVVIENATGGSGADTLLGNAVANTLTGNAGADSLLGRAGDDTLIGGAGNDRLDGGDGVDTISFLDGAVGVTVNLARNTVTGAQGTDTLVSIENVLASRGDDSITGSTGANKLQGATGNDRIDGGAGDDELYGDAGDDTLVGGLGNDYLAGGAGTDTADYTLAAAALTIDLRVTRAQNTGAGLDRLTGIENLTGSSFNDRLTGDGAANSFRGGNGDDTLFGLGGDDTLLSDGGNDVLNGGTGYDVLAGGAGTDRFVFDSLDGDLVRDWTSGEKIDVSAFRGSTFQIDIRYGRAIVAFDRDSDGFFDDGFFTVVVGSQAFTADALIL